MSRIKNVSFAQRDAAVGEIFVSVEKTSAIQHVIEGRWNEAGLIFVTEPSKHGIFIRKSVVHSDVKIVAGFTAHGDSEEIESWVDERVRRRKQRCKSRSQRIHRSGGKNIRWVAGAIRSDRNSAESRGIGERYGYRQGLPGVEDLPHKRGVMIAIKSHGPIRIAGGGVNGYRRRGRKKLGEVAVHHVLVRNERGLRYPLP